MRIWYPLPEGVTEYIIEQEIDGKSVSRKVIIQTPRPLDRSKSYPILFFFHGNGGQPDGFVSMLGPDLERDQWVGVYPEGYLRSWNLGKEDSTADDVAFVRTIVDDLKKYEELNLDRTFAAGFSNGAGMVHRLGIETDLFKN